MILRTILYLVSLLTIILAIFSLGMHADLFRLQRGIRGVPRHIAVMIGARAYGFSPRKAYQMFWFDFILMIIVSVMFFIVFNWMWAFGFILLYFVGLPILISIFTFFFRKRISPIEEIKTSQKYPSYKDGYSREEFLTILKKALGNSATMVKRKTVQPESPNKFLVKFVNQKKKPEDKPKE